MAWSTAQLAELAGTSLRAVRHYHAVGLLDVPHRAANGWKRYSLEHLAQLRGIVRLRELGFSLAEIDELGRGASLTTALERLDGQLHSSVEHLQRLRGEVAVLRRAGTANPALPTDLDLDPDLLNGPDEAFLVLVSCLLERPALDLFVSMLRDAYAEPALVAYDALPADADEPARAALAASMVGPTRRLRAAHPPLRELAAAGSADPARAMRLMSAALAELTNPAQADVVARLERLLTEGEQAG